MVLFREVGTLIGMREGTCKYVLCDDVVADKNREGNGNGQLHEGEQQQRNGRRGDHDWCCLRRDLL